MTLATYNAVFAFPNHLDANTLFTPTFTGGSWSSSLPRTNLQTRYLADVARTASASLVNAQTDVDLLRVASIRVFAFFGHNLSTAAKVRIRGSNVAATFTSPVYDSGWCEVYPAVYPLGTLPVGHQSWFTGRLTTEDAANYAMPYVKDFGVLYSARYWRIEFDDTANTAGYLQIGRMTLAQGFQVSINPSWGAKLGGETGTTRQTTDSGSAIYNDMPMNGTWSFAVEHQDDDMALVQVRDLMKRAGLSKQLVFVFDPTDTAHMHRRAMLCVFRQPSALTMAFFNGTTSQFDLIEEL